MKLLVVFALVAVAAAAPQQRGQSLLGRGVGALAKILRFDFNNDGTGTYGYAYEQDDGHKHQEQGELRNVGAENEAIAVKGSYEYVGEDGVTYTVNYVADENGYQPVIEQGPGGAVPGAIIASLVG